MCVLFDDNVLVSTRGSTIMYWSAHVGTQENSCRDVWDFSYKMVAYINPWVLRLTSEYNKIINCKVFLRIKLSSINRIRGYACSKLNKQILNFPTYNRWIPYSDTKNYDVISVTEYNFFWIFKELFCVCQVNLFDSICVLQKRKNFL